MSGPRTLYDKIWDSHVVEEQEDGTVLLYIDCHLVLEVTSPQAFDGLRAAGRKVRRPLATIAVADHNVPTTDRSAGIADPLSRHQVETLERNVREFGIPYFSMTDIRQGIVHVIGPEQGYTQPGTTVVCGDSHTATHGAFGALAFGIGTSEVEHVLATQTLIARRSRNMRVTVDGALSFGVTAKDLILALIGAIGTAGGTGHVIEYAGSAIRGLTHGRPHDGVEHVDRGGRARRADRAGRRDLRLSQGPAAGAAVRRLGPGRRRLADAAVGPGRCLRLRGGAGRGRHCAAGHLGHQPAGRRRHRRLGARSGGRGRRQSTGRHGTQPRLHGPRSPA